jgi:predicted dehydrogenase
VSTPRAGALAVGASEPAGPTREIGVGMLGHAFMGKAHAHAYRSLAYIGWPPPLRPRLVAIAGRDRERTSAAAERYGFARAYTDWQAVIEDDEVALFDNVAPNNLHAEPTIAAARAGKHVLCEKPLGRSAEESYEIWQAVAACGVKHMCAFNYRFVPAVRLAREMLESGALGEIYHFRASYLQEWALDPNVEAGWRFQKAASGSGALGDLGAHAIDLARFLVGEIVAVSGHTRTFIAERPGGIVDVDDAFESIVEFEHGALGTIEASRVCAGRKNALTWELNGAKGSLSFDLERLNELRVELHGSSPGVDAQGFRQVLVSEAHHPFLEQWWPQGHMLGWEHAITHELEHLLRTIAQDGQIGPYGADLSDGYRAAEVCDAILRSSQSGRREPVSYRSL